MAVNLASSSCFSKDNSKNIVFMDKTHSAKRFTFSSFWYRWHKRFMLLVGWQFFVWALTGLYMVSINIHVIHGETYLPKPSNLDLTQFTYPINTLHTRYPDAVAISAEFLRGEQVFKVKHSINPYAATLVSASTGETLPKLTATQIKEIAVNLSTDPIREFRFLDKAPKEVSSRYTNVYQVTFDRFDDLTLYMHESTGEVVTVRHLWWRIFDVFWRLHIMDYDDGENIHNILLKCVAVVGFIAVGMGLGTLYFRLRKQQWLRLKVQKGKIQKIKQARLKHWQKIHKMSACVVGVQMMIWLGSGIYLSFIPLAIKDYPNLPNNLYRSNSINTSYLANTDATSPQTLAALSTTLLFGVDTEFKKVTWQPATNFQETLIQWHSTATKHAYQKNDITLTDSAGIPISWSKADLENRWHTLTSDPDFTGITFHEEGKDVLRGEENSIWEITFKTYSAIYRAHSGERIRVLDEHWDWHDLMLKLHFMDYPNNGSFNSIWNIILAISALILSITGLRFSLRKWGKSISQNTYIPR